MKEATGELNMTVITVVAIAAVSALFMVFVWPNIQARIALNQACSGVDANGNSTITEENGGNVLGSNSAQCQSWTCTVTVQGRSFSQTCQNSNNVAGGGGGEEG